MDGIAILKTALVALLLHQGLLDAIRLTSETPTTLETIDETDADLVVRGSARIVELCPYGWSSLGTKCYKVFGLETGVKRTWHEANRKCLEMNADLASVHSKEEEEFLSGIIRKPYTSTRTWIGLHTDEDSNGMYFRWTDNSALDYVNWGSDQPSFSWKGLKEECVEMWLYESGEPSEWNDCGCNAKRTYVCQISLDSQTATPNYSEDAGSQTASLNSGEDADFEATTNSGLIAGISICVVVLTTLAAVAFYYLCPSTRMKAWWQSAASQQWRHL